MVSNFLSSFAGGATGAASVQIVISAVDDFSKTLAKANNSFKDFGKAVETMTGLALASLASFTLYSVSKYAEVERLNKRLAFSYGGLANDVEIASAKIKDSTTLSMEEVKGAFLSTKPLIDALGISYVQQAEIIQRAADVSAVTGKELNEVLSVFSSVMSGRAGPAAKELGIIIDEDTKGMDAMQKGLIGVKNLLSDTSYALGGGESDKSSINGRMRMFANAVEDATQSFGEGFLDGLGIMGDSFEEINKNLDPALWKEMGKAVGALAQGLQFLGKVLLFIKDMFREIFTIGAFFFQRLANGEGVVKSFTRANEDYLKVLKVYNSGWKETASILDQQVSPAFDNTAKKVNVLAQSLGLGGSNAFLDALGVGATGGGGESGGGGSSGGGKGGGGSSAKFFAMGKTAKGDTIPFFGETQAEADYFASIGAQGAPGRSGYGDNSAMQALKTGTQGSYGRAGGKASPQVQLLRAQGRHAEANQLIQNTGYHNDANMLITSKGEVHEFASNDTLSLQASNKGGVGGGTTVNVYVQGSVWSLKDLARALDKELSNILFNKISMRG